MVRVIPDLHLKSKISSRRSHNSTFLFKKPNTLHLETVYMSSKVDVCLFGQNMDAKVEADHGNLQILSMN